jgi:hypothetical protein
VNSEFLRYKIRENSSRERGDYLFMVLKEAGRAAGRNEGQG